MDWFGHWSADAAGKLLLVYRQTCSCWQCILWGLELLFFLTTLLFCAIGLSIDSTSCCRLLQTLHGMAWKRSLCPPAIHPQDLPALLGTTCASQIWVREFLSDLTALTQQSASALCSGCCPQAAVASAVAAVGI